MSDCPNVEIRELLPELMHGRLDAATAARVREHIAECAECAAEFELLERVRSVYAAGPSVNTAAIVRALPAARAPRIRSFRLLKMAASIVVVLAGALVMREVQKGLDARRTGDIVIVDTATPIDSQTPTTVSGAPRVLAMSLSELDDLDEDELETLLGALDRIDAAPVAEPDTLIGSVSGIGS